MDLALLVRAFEKERRDLRFESFAGAAAHLVLARHAAGRGRKGAAAGVLKLLSRRDHGLRADDAGTAHFFCLTLSVCDLPIARQELNGLDAFVLVRHGIGPMITLLVRIVLSVYKGRLYGHSDVACRAYVHRQIIGSDRCQSKASTRASSIRRRV